MGCERYADNLGLKGATTLGVGLGLGVNPGLGLYKKFLEFYGTLDFTEEREKNKTIVHYTTEMLTSEGLSNTSEIQYVGGVYVYPKEYFCPINQTTRRLHITGNTRTIHHYVASWEDKAKGGWKSRVQPFIPEKLLLLWHDIKAWRKL